MARYNRMLLLVIGFLLIGTVSNFSSAVGRTPQPPVCANLLQDPGFEDYTPNPYWEEFSINVDTPLCSAAVCGTGFVGPRNGIIWAWFTRGTVDDYAYLSQSVTIPEGIATLTFYLAIGPAAGAGADDVFFVDIDGFDVFVTDATETASYIGYQLVTVDVSSFADGNLHDLTLTADTYDEPVSFHVDDISLCVEPGTPLTGKKIFLPFTISPPYVTQAPEFDAWEVPWVDTRFTLTWNSVEGADIYTLEEDTDWNFPHPTVVYQGTQASWTATWKSVQTYYYRVRGQNLRGPGPWSNSMFVSYEGVYPSADAGIASGSSANFGTNNKFSVGYYSSACPYGVPVATGVNRGLIAFDTTGVPTNLNFSKVELSIYLDRICFISSLSGQTRTITAYRVTSPWTESGVTWNNAPGIGEGYGSVNITLTTSQDVFGRYEIDITGLVRDWLNGSKPNYGLILRSSSESSSYPAGFTFDARDGDGATPYLSITFSAGDTASLQQQLDLQPPGERQCTIIEPGRMLCALKR